MVAHPFEIGLATVDLVMASYRKNLNRLNTPILPKSHPEYIFDASYQESIRSYTPAG